MDEKAIGGVGTSFWGGEGADGKAGRDLAGAVGFDPLDALVLDLLEWVGPEGRAYEETMEAWRTSCPRLPVWEEANARGFVVLDRRRGGGSVAFVSARGVEALRAAGRKGVVKRS